MRKLKWQVFISFNLLFTFIVMFFSGVILYFKPEGTVARWLDWKVLGVDKSGWESVHTVFSFLFLAFALFHILKVHVKNLRGYILNNKTGGAKRELYFSILISLLFLAGTVMYLPPFDWIYQAGNGLSEGWSRRVQVTHQTVEPRQSLEQVAREMGMDAPELQQWMKRQGIEDLSHGATLMQHAENLGITPYTLYERMRAGTSSDPNESFNKIYHTITLEELALLFEVKVTDIQDYLMEEYDLEKVAPDASLYDISIQARQTPRKMKTHMLNHLRM